MSDSPYIVTATAENIRQILETSFQTPVLFDFWADWCQPCRMLMPILAQLADEYQGRFILAKLDTEAERDIAAQFGIRSLPTVKLFKDGQPVDEFMGALPEGEVRHFLDKHLPRESDKFIALAAQQMSSGDLAAAKITLEQAAEMDPGNARIALTQAQLLAASGDSEGATKALDALPADEQDDPEVQALRGSLHFSGMLAGAPDSATLNERLRADENDHQARLQMAAHLVMARHYEHALELLLDLMRRDRTYGDDAARKTMLKIFDLLGDDPMAARYRGKMFNLLH